MQEQKYGKTTCPRCHNEILEGEVVVNEFNGEGGEHLLCPELRRKEQAKSAASGFALLEVLIAFALVVLITAIIGQSLQSVVQGQNEKNISAALLAIQAAEASYEASYQTFATGATLTALSTCPSGSAPTASAACLLPTAYTSGKPVYGYNLTITDPADAPACVTAPCGFLAVAEPTVAANGRLVLCADTDGALHAEVKSSQSVTTDATCSALPVRAAGQASAAPQASTVYSTGTLTSSQSVTPTSPLIFSLNLPAGSYFVTGTLVDTNIAIQYDLQCTLSSGSTTIALGPPAATSMWQTTISGTVTLTSAGSVTFECGGGRVQTTWQENLTALPFGTITN